MFRVHVSHPLVLAVVVWPACQLAKLPRNYARSETPPFARRPEQSTISVIVVLTNVVTSCGEKSQPNEKLFDNLALTSLASQNVGRDQACFGAAKQWKPAYSRIEEAIGSRLRSQLEL
ncbi:MAG: hypothetical protein CMJ64_25725 [Planctomycetaceae bacterium]|nr:hypothetical protein [Planctomycetaceae bacterium]